MVKLEHANLSVAEPDAMVRFLTTAFPEFAVRSDQRNDEGRRWVHVGTDDTYIALYHAPERKPDARALYGDLPGINHLAYEVDDVEAVRQRLTQAGYRDTTIPNAHPYRKRIYFLDPEGNEWEFVEYLSDDAAQRNDYQLG